jgi:molybdenum cofactor cytidylyltransferase
LRHLADVESGMNDQVDMVGAGEVAGAVLAAGRSTRMRGVNKLLVPFEGVPAIARICSTALGSDLRPVIVVLGHESEAVREAVLRGCAAGVSEIRFTFNARYREGRLSSVATALDAVPESCEAVMFIRGDQPWLSTDLIARVLRGYRAGGRPLAFPVYRGRKGSPTVFGRACFDRLLALRADGGTLELAEELWEHASRLEVDDPRCVSGLDTPEDLRGLLGEDRDAEGAGESNP